MTDALRRRSLLLGALALALALALGLAVSFVPVHDHSAAAASARQAREDFRADMRVLWEDHATWTRMAIIGILGRTPDADAAVRRLLRNQIDIGNAVKPFYGQAAGDRLAALLTDHILIAADLLGAARDGDDAALVDADARWKANADEIAAFLAAANPTHWPEAEMRAMMREHLALTAAEAVARLNADWEGDVEAYDAVRRQILHMADMLSDGIIAQFPGAFRAG
ncbi:MAG TPA: hypothetical protein VFH63_08350 [candidate division Zixibacteria bacterium]|nr:hypothetical protein [candidate division Zixibacteria bacterium]